VSSTMHQFNDVPSSGKFKTNPKGCVARENAVKSMRRIRGYVSIYLFSTKFLS
jgi:hypothetical protein